MINFSKYRKKKENFLKFAMNLIISFAMKMGKEWRTEKRQC